MESEYHHSPSDIGSFQESKRLKKEREHDQKNPAAKPLAILAFLTLGVVGIGSLLDFQSLLTSFALPLLFLCSLLTLTYTLFAIQLGRISMVDKLGRVLHYTRKDEPIGFYLLASLYLLLSVPSTVYLGSRLLIP